MIFNVYGAINLINAFCALSIASIIFFKKGRKPIQLTYGLFSLLLFFYGLFYWLWSSETDLSKALYWFKLLMYPTCVIHVVYLHFTLEICDKIKSFRRILIAAYVLCFLFSLLNHFDALYDLQYVRQRLPFLFWPHALPQLGFLIASEVLTVLFSFYVLLVSAKESFGISKLRYKSLLVAGMIGWVGAATNWVHFYDTIFIPPLGNPMISVYLLFTFYLIFKHDLLGLDFAIKRTFVYTLLTLSISLTYALFVTLSERFFSAYIGYSSFIGSAFAALTIAIMFVPLRDALTAFIDKRFFGMSIHELSQENLLMRQRLQNQDRMKAVATLAAGMAHEIKNPLTAIKTFTEHLPGRSSDAAFIRQFTRIVGAEVDKIDSIVKQLLTFSKPTAPHLERMNIIQIVDDTLYLLEAELVQHKIRLEKKYYAAIVWINGDKKQLQQAFLNLFLNAIQAMPQGGKLGVCVEIKSDLINVLISDTGCGISKENISHIFDPFFTTKEAGTGLGLAITHGILKEHKCKINIKSQENVGTTFEAIFPGI